MRSLFLIAGVLCVSFLTQSLPLRAGEEKTDDVAKILNAKNFWDKAGKKDGRQWTAAEKTQLEKLKTESKDAVVRLRANKVLVDLAANGRLVGKDAETLVIECFRHLEKELANAAVKKLCAEQGFTHYIGTVGNGVFLIEHVQLRGFNGGLNLKWDSATNSVVEMESWGDVQGK